jgi:hypothetical protein
MEFSKIKFLRWPSFAVAFVALSASVAVAANYLNFTIECSGSGTSDCPLGATIFQGSIIIDNPLLGGGTSSIVVGSATSYINPSSGAYGSTPYATNSTPGTVTYTCALGLCGVSNASFSSTYDGATFSFSGNSSILGGDITISMTSPTSMPGLATSAQGGCFSTGLTNALCTLDSSPLSNPEIDGAALPKVALLLASLILLGRSRKDLVCTKLSISARFPTDRIAKIDSN